MDKDLRIRSGFILFPKGNDLEGWRYLMKAEWLEKFDCGVWVFYEWLD